MARLANDIRAILAKSIAEWMLVHAQSGLSIITDVWRNTKSSTADPVFSVRLG